MGWSPIRGTKQAPMSKLVAETHLNCVFPCGSAGSTPVRGTNNNKRCTYEDKEDITKNSSLEMDEYTIYNSYD